MKKQRVAMIGINPNKVHSSGVYYLKAYAKKSEKVREIYDIDVAIFDSLIPEQSNALELYTRRLLDNDYEIMCFSVYCWNVKLVHEMIYIIKKVNPEVTILLGGPEVSGNADSYLSSDTSIDYVIEGEGEIAFQEFLLFYQDLLKIENVHNLVYRKDGKMVRNEKKVLDDLDEIPSIYLNNEIDVNNIGDSFYSYETKRGCQYKCSYCFHHGGAHYIREFSLERVLAELEIILNSNLKYVWIIDPCFNENEERAIQILRFIRENNKNNIEFGFELRNETLSENMIYEMSLLESTRFIALGLQTLNQQALSAIHRDFNLQKFEENMSIIKKFYQESDKVHIDLIFGLPNTTLEDYMEAVDYCVEWETTVFTQPLKVLPGTELIKEKDKYGLICSQQAPYEVIANNTFSYKDMCKAKKLNVGLYLYQLHPCLRKWMNYVKEINKKRYSELFLEIADYLWQQGKDAFFTNYVSFRLGFVLENVKEIIYDLYHVECEVDACLDENEIVHIDWGSIANHMEYME